MSDKRELILSRLLEIAAEVDGVSTALRNTESVSEEKLPAITIFDADETANDEDPPGRPVGSPRRVSMTPEIYIDCMAVPETVGTSLNTLRSAFMKAVFADETIKALTLNGIGIRYEGCTTALARGRTMSGSMGVGISFTYILKPDEL